MFCTKCGKQIPDDSKFCPYCGNPAETPENMQKRVDKPTPHIPDKPPQTSSKKSTVIASVIGIAILLGVITMAFISKPASTTSKPASSTKTTQAKSKEEVQKYQHQRLLKISKLISMSLENLLQKFRSKTIVIKQLMVSKYLYLQKIISTKKFVNLVAVSLLPV